MALVDEKKKLKAENHKLGEESQDLRIGSAEGGYLNM